MLEQINEEIPEELYEFGKLVHKQALVAMANMCVTTGLSPGAVVEFILNSPEYEEASREGLTKLYIHYKKEKIKNANTTK